MSLSTNPRSPPPTASQPGHHHNNNNTNNDEDPESSPPTTPSKLISSKSKLAALSSASDPIVAPGYGTYKDLLRLTQQLNQAAQTPDTAEDLYTVHDIWELMKARGRGGRTTAAAAAHGRASRRSSRGAVPEAGGNTSSTTTAWADFMMEEGVAAATTTTPSDKKRKAPWKDDEDYSNTNNISRGDDDDNENHDDDKAEREYRLPTAWESITAVSASKPSGSRKKKAHTTATSDVAGTLVQTGTLQSLSIGRGKLTMPPVATAPTYHCLIPTRLLPQISFQRVFCAGHAVHVLALTSDHQLYGWGRNESHQLTAGHDEWNEATAPGHVAHPVELDAVDQLARKHDTHVRQASVGKSHTMILLQNGQLVGLGNNKFGQCGTGSFHPPTVMSLKITASVDDDEGGDDDDDNDGPVRFAQVSCGEDFTCAISTRGHLYTTGCSQHGQLGNGETGEYFVTANKLAFTNCSSLTRRSYFGYEPDEKLHTNSNTSSKKVQRLPDSAQIRLQQVECGKHHVLVLEADCSENDVEATMLKRRPRVFSFGCGDYGVLGHGVQQDEYFPRLVGILEVLPGLSQPYWKLAAGSQCSLLCVGSNPESKQHQHNAGSLYYWGKHRSVGEAVMRPQSVDTLMQPVRLVAAGGQTVVCATAVGDDKASQQVWTWGQGFYGELGLSSGKKSSAKPSCVEGLTGRTILDVTAGYGNIYYIVDNDDDDGDEELPEVTSDDMKNLDRIMADMSASSASATSSTSGNKKR